MRIGRWDTSTWAGLAPNGAGHQKPHHYREMFKTLWQNRGELPFAWRIITQGVCDGCALGVAGLHDWTIEGTHLCTVRLNLLELNTMPALDERRVGDVRSLEVLDPQDLRRLGRIPYPLRRRRGEKGFTRIGWDEALGEIAATLSASEAQRCALYMTSRGITNEVYYAAQKAWRGIGSANIENAARVCHSPSTAALKDSIGVGASTCSYADFWDADWIVFFGSDVANNQPVMMKYLYLAKREGTRVAVVNPFHTPGMDRYWVPSNAESALFGTKIADDFYPVTAGGDIAFIAGVLKLLIERGALDEHFLAEHTTGWEDVAASATGLGWQEIEQRSGLTRSDCERFADFYARAGRVIFVWSMGITQHAHGADNVRAIVNLALARGMVGRDGAGLMPIRGHSGVQGGAEMGAYATALPGGVPVEADAAARLGARYGFEIPAEPGLRAVETVDAAGRGEIDLLYSSGGNFMEVLPDPAAVRAALEKVPVRVHQDIVLSTQMLVEPGEAVYVLPAKTRYEQEGGGTETTTERRVAFSPEIRGRRIGEARAEWRIFGELADRVRGDRLASFDSAQSIRDEIAQVVPAYAGIEKLAETGDAIQWGGRHLCAGGEFPMPESRARLVAVDMPGSDLPEGKFKLTTRRGKQFNSMVHADVDPLTGAHRDAVFVSAQDAAELGLGAADTVDVISEHGRMRGRVRISRIAPRNVAVHWPEGNVLIAPGHIDPEGGVPDYNAVVEVRAT